MAICNVVHSCYNVIFITQNIQNRSLFGPINRQMVDFNLKVVKTFNLSFLENLFEIFFSRILLTCASFRCGVSPSEQNSRRRTPPLCFTEGSYDLGNRAGVRDAYRFGGRVYKKCFSCKGRNSGVRGRRKRKREKGKEIPPHSQIEKTKRQSDKSHSFQKFKKLKISNILSDIETHNKFNI